MNVRSVSLLFVSSVFVVTTVACSDAGGGPSGTTDGGNGNDGAVSQNDSGVASDGSTPNVTPVDITFAASCPKVTPCGGPVVGAWHYTGVCVSDAFGAFKQQCPSASVTNQKGTVKGRVVFDATKVTRISTVSFSATIGVPAQCSAGQCAAVETALAKNVDKVSCKSDGGGGCACDVSLTQAVNEANGYTIEGNTVKIADGSTYDYCVAGTKLSYVPGGSTKEQAGAYEMTKE